MPTDQLRFVLRQLRRAVLPVAASLSDRQLLARYLSARDQAAFELLVRRHEKMILGLLQRTLGDSHASDDAFQATFLILAQKAGSIAKGDSVGAWIYRVAYRVALRARRQASRRDQREHCVENLPEKPAESRLL